MEAQMLGDFIWLADYMTVSCCYLLTVGTAEKLAEILQARCRRETASSCRMLISLNSKCQITTDYILLIT